jgi:hypothetical protein
MRRINYLPLHLCRPFQPASEQSVVTGHGESPESPRPEDGVGLAGSQYHRGGTVRTTVRKRPLTVDAWAKRVGKTPSTKRLPALLEPNGRPTTPAFVDDFRSVKHGFSMRPLKTGYCISKTLNLCLRQANHSFNACEMQAHKMNNALKLNIF